MKFSTYSFMVALCLASFWVHSSYATDLTSPTPTPVLLVNAPPPPTPTPTVCAPSSNDVDCDGTPNASDDNSDGDSEDNQSDNNDDNDQYSDANDPSPGGPGTTQTEWMANGWCNSCPTNTPTPTATPCVESWGPPVGGSYTLPSQLQTKINTLANKIKLTIKSTTFSASYQTGTCCQSGEGKDKSKTSGGVTLVFAAKNIGPPYLSGSISTSVGPIFGHTFTTQANFGLLFSADVSFSGNGWVEDSECNGITVGGDLDLDVNFSCGGGVTFKTCTITSSGESCNCYDVYLVQASSRVFGQLDFNTGLSGGNTLAL